LNTEKWKFFLLRDEVLTFCLKSQLSLRRYVTFEHFCPITGIESF